MGVQRYCLDNIKRRKRISKTKSVKDEVSIEAGKSIIMSSNDTPATAERFENKSACNCSRKVI